MAQRGNMPSGQARQGYRPTLPVIPGGQSSAVSTDSLLSQIPLPYHYLDDGYDEQPQQTYSSPQLGYDLGQFHIQGDAGPGPEAPPNTGTILRHGPYVSAASGRYPPTIGNLAPDPMQYPEMAYHRVATQQAQGPMFSQGESMQPPQPNYGYQQPASSDYGGQPPSFGMMQPQAVPQYASMEELQAHLNNLGSQQDREQSPQDLARQLYGELQQQQQQVLGQYLYPPQSFSSRSVSPANSVASQPAGAPFGSAQLYDGSTQYESPQSGGLQFGVPDHGGSNQTRRGRRPYQYRSVRGSQRPVGHGRADDRVNNNDPRQAAASSTRGGHQGRGALRNVQGRPDSRLADSMSFNQAAPATRSTARVGQTSAFNPAAAPYAPAPQLVAEQPLSSTVRTEEQQAPRQLGHIRCATGSQGSVAAPAALRRSSREIAIAAAHESIKVRSARSSLSRASVDGSDFQQRTPGQGQNNGQLFGSDNPSQQGHISRPSSVASGQAAMDAYNGGTYWSATAAPVTPTRNGTTSAAMDRALASARARRESELSQGQPGPSAIANVGNPAASPFQFMGPTTVVLVPRGPSTHLQNILNGREYPALAAAFARENMPFVTSALQNQRPEQTGLIKISNIPYSVTRQEIIAFVGRNARLIPDTKEPVHIIMERVTSKTMDAYVEFINVQEAINCVTRFENNRLNGRGGRLGDRHVELEIVGHEQLMKDLFPKAKNVVWHGPCPEILEHDVTDITNSGFQGFLSKEELVMLVKHVEDPKRSPFAKDCPQRPFECLIDTLIKYPWYMVDHITIEDRDLLFTAASRLIEMLFQRVANDAENTTIDIRLLNRVKRACFQCDGFTEAQKDDCAFICGLTGGAAGLSPYADHWYIFRVIGPKAGVVPDVLEYYQALIREATTSEDPDIPLADRAQAPLLHGLQPSIFGQINIHYGQDVTKMSIAEVARIEWTYIEDILRSVLTDEISFADQDEIIRAIMDVEGRTSVEV